MINSEKKAIVSLKPVQSFESRQRRNEKLSMSATDADSFASEICFHPIARNLPIAGLFSIDHSSAQVLSTTTNHKFSQEMMLLC